MARTDRGLRWTGVTIDSGDSAQAALDRISIPPDVLDRIAPTASPRSSLIISDEPLHRETNYRTEFVVALHNQPQGGLAMRRPPAEVRVARGNPGDFGFMRWFGGQYSDQRQGAPSFFQQQGSQSFFQQQGSQRYDQRQGTQYYDQRQGSQPYVQRQGSQYYAQRQGNQSYVQRQGSQRQGSQSQDQRRQGWW
jgi:hypothetical protein